MDQSRFFPNPFLDNPSLLSTTIQNWSPVDCLQQALRIAERCLQYYDEPSTTTTTIPLTSSSPSSCGSLYCGSLGTKCYLRLRMAQRIRDNNTHIQEPKLSVWHSLVQTALSIAHSAVDYESQQLLRRPQHHSARVTLLGSPWVGAKVMLILLLYELYCYNDNCEKATSQK